jgi:L-lactate dehydrogenase (cytochrome)
VLTIDTAVAGIRERDVRNGISELLGKNLFAKVPFLPDVLAHPGWLISFLLDGGVPDLANVVLADGKPMPLIDVGTALAESAVTWQDFDWLRKLWTGPIVVKGVLTGDDARRAVDAGAAALVVSNHGGRQLDSCSATLRVLPEIVAAVHGQVEVLLDGGVRRGGDAIKALCLGARAVLVGRAYAYGLAAAGSDGVARALQILRADLDRTLKLLGCSSVSALDSSYVCAPAEWFCKLR